MPWHQIIDRMLYLNYVCKYFREIQIRFIVIYVIKIGRRRTINKEDMLPLSMQKVLKNKRWNGKFVNTSLTRFTTRSTGPGRISHNVELAADLSLMTISKIRRRSYQKHLPFRIRFRWPHLFQQHRNQTKLKIPSQQFSDEVPGNGSHMIRNVMMMRRWNGLSAKLIRGTESAERFQ